MLFEARGFCRKDEGVADGELRFFPSDYAANYIT